MPGILLRVAFQPQAQVHLAAGEGAAPGGFGLQVAAGRSQVDPLIAVQDFAVFGAAGGQAQVGGARFGA